MPSHRNGGGVAFAKEEPGNFASPANVPERIKSYFGFIPRTNCERGSAIRWAVGGRNKRDTVEYRDGIARTDKLDGPEVHSE